MTRRAAHQPRAGDDETDARTEEADAVVVPRLDEVGAHPRPANLGTTYVEIEFATGGEEQRSLWSAEGEQAAHPFQVTAEGLTTAARADDFLVREHEPEVRAAHAAYQQAMRVLQPYVRREPAAKLRYWICWPILALGDASGVLSAAISLGDVPAVAAGQALAAGLAAACAGLVGGEFKHRQLASAREREVDTLTQDELRYRRFFTGAGSRSFLSLIGGLSLLVVLLMAVAVFALRASVEGSAAGLTFGLLVAVTAIASGLLGYAAADEVADLLASDARRVRCAEVHHRKLAAAAAVRQHAEAAEAARSLHAEYEHRGQAAGHHMTSLGWRVQRRNPQVLGHGLPNGEATGIVGRRPRRDSAS